MEINLHPADQISVDFLQFQRFSEISDFWGAARYLSINAVSRSLVFGHLIFPIFLVGNVFWSFLVENGISDGFSVFW